MSFCVLLCACRSRGGRVQQLGGNSAREGRTLQRVTVSSLTVKSDNGILKLMENIRVPTKCLIFYEVCFFLNTLFIC